jgi:hypothetical protein
MQKKHRNGRVSTKTSVEGEIAHLRGLDHGGLRARWQGVFQRSAPAHLTWHLLFAIIAYRIQADRLGDLDHETRQVLDRTDAKEAGPVTSARLRRDGELRTHQAALLRESPLDQSERDCARRPGDRFHLASRFCRAPGCQRQRSGHAENLVPGR